VNARARARKRERERERERERASERAQQRAQKSETRRAVHTRALTAWPVNLGDDVQVNRTVRVVVIVVWVNRLVIAAEAAESVDGQGGKVSSGAI
jgi:hypothetical protein